MTVSHGDSPNYSTNTAGARKRAGAVTSIAGIRLVLLEILAMIDMMQGQREDPSVMQVNIKRKRPGRRWSSNESEISK